VNEDLIRQKIGQALFRCDLIYQVPRSIAEMRSFVLDEVNLGTDALVVCGGDGTINTVLQMIMPLLEAGQQVPPLCIVSSGTANDLAYELGINQKIQQAARALLEGVPKKIDVIEIESGGEKKYMITCGGIGIPARTASLANTVRGSLRQMGEQSDRHPLVRWLSNTSYKTIKNLGSSIYSLMLFYAFAEWDRSKWSIEIDPLKDKPFTTRSGFVFVNNQASLGSNFFPAPYTANDDGLVNILVAPVKGWFSLLQALVEIHKGNVSWDKRIRSLEVPEVRIRDLKKQKGLCFFGDGEILFQSANELNIKCLPKALPFVIKA
jgi:diacylglycerol kinase family enzyme